jgi:arylformamidase
VARSTADLRTRLAHVLSISGLHDLRPLRATAMNDTLGIDAAEARAESPALLDPLPGTRLTAWVGAAERPEFLRPDLLAKPGRCPVSRPAPTTTRTATTST